MGSQPSQHGVYAGASQRLQLGLCLVSADHCGATARPHHLRLPQVSGGVRRTLARPFVWRCFFGQKESFVFLWPVNVSAFVCLFLESDVSEGKLRVLLWASDSNNWALSFFDRIRLCFFTHLKRRMGFSFLSYILCLCIVVRKLTGVLPTKTASPRKARVIFTRYANSC